LYTYVLNNLTNHPTIATNTPQYDPTHTIGIQARTTGANTSVTTTLGVGPPEKYEGRARAERSPQPNQQAELARNQPESDTRKKGHSKQWQATDQTLENHDNEHISPDPTGTKETHDMPKEAIPGVKKPTVNTHLEKIGRRPRADRRTQANRHIETIDTQLGSGLDNIIRKQHSNTAHAQQEDWSNQYICTQVLKSTSTSPMNRDHAQTPIPRAPPHQIDNVTATHTHSTHNTLPSQQVNVDVKAAGESSNPVPPNMLSHLDYRLPHNNPTIQNTCRKMEPLAIREYKNEGQQTPGKTHNQNQLENTTPQKYTTTVSIIDTAHQ
jgi:hypothetical protein